MALSLGHVTTVLFIGHMCPAYVDSFQSRLRHDVDLQS